MYLDPDSIYERLEKAGMAWANADGDASLLEESRKIILSQLMAKSPESSVAAKEAWAYRHADYDVHIKGQVEARKEANRARVKWEAEKIRADLLRTKSVNERSTLGHQT